VDTLGEPVQIGEVTVRTDDLLLADQDGVIVRRSATGDPSPVELRARRGRHP
jgi:regulator of RNase E activity RraA